jgi:hypothetical protein
MGIRQAGGEGLFHGQQAVAGGCAHGCVARAAQRQRRRGIVDGELIQEVTAAGRCRFVFGLGGVQGYAYYDPGAGRIVLDMLDLKRKLDQFQEVQFKMKNSLCTTC